MTIGDQIKEAVKASPETLYRIAKDSGVEYGALSRFVSGERPDIRLSTIEKLAEYFELTLAKKKGRG